MAHHMRKCVAVLTVLFTLTNARLGDSGGKQHGNGNSEAHSSVVAIRGYKVSLPCDLSSPIPDDPVQLILWYREDTGAPIYTFDVRGRDYYSAKTWRDDESWGERASLDPTRRRPLMLRSVKAEDEGVYRCRVDFKMSPTRNSLVNLTVIVPPEVPKIYEKSGREMGSVIGPYLEGDNLTLICRGVHGRPAPKLIWFHEQALLDSTYTVYENGTVENVLEVSRLKRNDLNTTFSCQASNNNVTDAVSNPVRLSMNFRPYEVKILGSRNAALSADQSYPIACHAIGSWPPAVITWWKNGIRLNGTEELTTDGGNVSRSTVMYTPRVDDVGKFLVCRAENPEIPGSAIEDRWSPEIYYVPIPKLVLGKNLNKDNIREGIDVYFDCEIKSNPKFFKVSWKHNGLPLHHYNKSSGIILSDRHLAIQKVSRHQAGNYSCLAVNTEGVGESMRVELSVKYAPVCSKRQKKVYGVARREKVLVKCEIEAEPGAESFRWRFNNSDENYDIPQMSFTTSPEGSVLTYTPMTEKDYGTLTCWGTNEVGQQQEPCVFQVVPAGEPDPPHNCSISNQTSTFLEIDCEQGFDGGLAQFFVMEVYDASSQLLKYNVSSEVPHFVVDGLVPGSSLIISMYAANGKGKSSNLVFQASTLRLPERITDANTVKPTLEAFRITPVLGILIGVVAALVMAALIIVVVMKFRDSAMRSKNSNSANKGDRMSPAGASSVGTSANLPLRADMDEDDASTTYGLMDMKSGVESHGDLDFQQRCHEKDMLKLNNIIPYSDNDKDPNGPLTISRFNATPKQNGDMMYTSLDVSMPMPVDDTYVSYCGRNDASGLMYATIDHPQRIAMSHRPLGVPSAATLGGVTTMTLPHGAHLQHQMHQMQHPLQQQVPSLIQVPSSLSGGSGLMAGGSSVAIAGDPRSLTRQAPYQQGTVTTAATELSLDSSQIPLIGRPNRESSSQAVIGFEDIRV